MHIRWTQTDDDATYPVEFSADIHFWFAAADDLRIDRIDNLGVVTYVTPEIGLVADVARDAVVPLTRIIRDTIERRWQLFAEQCQKRLEERE